MKAIVLFAVLVAGVAAELSEVQYTDEVALTSDQRNVIDVLTDAVQLWSNTIVSSNLDPLNVQSKIYNWRFPLPSISSVSAVVGSLECTGLSRVIINTLRFPLFSSTLIVDFEIPQVVVTLGRSRVDVSLFGVTIPAEISGSITISRIRMVGEVRYHNSIISGSTLVGLSMDLTFDGIESDMSAFVHTTCMSSRVNNFFTTTLPAALNARKEQINQYVDAAVLAVILAGQ